jgi:hypothetical protein
VKEFFRSYTESHEGAVGDFYCEVDDGLIVRHVSVFPEGSYWATPSSYNDERYDFTDRPEFGDPDSTTERISQGDFERVWDLATRG